MCGEQSSHGGQEPNNSLVSPFWGLLLPLQPSSLKCCSRTCSPGWQGLRDLGTRSLSIPSGTKPPLSHGPSALAASLPPPVSVRCPVPSQALLSARSPHLSSHRCYLGEEAVPSPSQPSFGQLQRATRSPLNLPFSTLNDHSSLSRCHKTCAPDPSVLPPFCGRAPALPRLFCEKPQSVACFQPLTPPPPRRHIPPVPCHSSRPTRRTAFHIAYRTHLHGQSRRRSAGVSPVPLMPQRTAGAPRTEP